MMQKESNPAPTRDIPPDSTLQDQEERAKCEADDIEKREEALLDEAIELTFPASDPISVPSYAEACQRSKLRKNHAAQRTS
jgi:hypothetical protein